MLMFAAERLAQAAAAAACHAVPLRQRFERAAPDARYPLLLP